MMCRAGLESERAVKDGIAKHHASGMILPLELMSAVVASQWSWEVKKQTLQLYNMLIGEIFGHVLQKFLVCQPETPSHVGTWWSYTLLFDHRY
jgi:hypothetical protein